MAKLETIIILDFGSQYTQLIARRVRECKVFCEILPFNSKIEEIAKKKPKAIILSGGPASVTDLESPICDEKIFGLGIPVLGICYGMQLTAKLFGEEVAASTKREYGKTHLILDDRSVLFAALKKEIIVWMSHGDKVNTLPKGFKKIAHTSNAPIAAMANKKKKIYSVQFHPEVVHTPDGKQILENFLYKISDCKGNWTMKSFVNEAIAQIRKTVGKDKVICAVSGGVDSSAMAFLMHRALGDQLVCIFVNNGVLRKNEPETVVAAFKNSHINLNYVDAAERFLSRLKGITEPELKRKIIGNEFIRVFEEGARKDGGAKFLAQGTLYPDVIESRSVRGPSATIKTHHNVGGLPSDMKFKLVEPFKELFKDEVRLVGKELGLPDDFINRHPFPGPGLAIRILGEVTPAALEMLREADAIVIEEIKKAGLYNQLWQAFAVLLPVKSVGVMGDERTYENVIAVRAVTSLDAMTANFANVPYILFERLSNRIINEVKGVNRVVYDISSKPPATIEWE